MAIAMSLELTTTLVDKRTAAKILRETNREVGTFVARRILPYKFNRYAYTAYRQYGLFRRTGKWRREKFKKVGHDIPNVFTGRMKSIILRPGRPGHQVTATRNGGRVWIRHERPMTVAQRAELEVVNDRDRENMAKTAGDYFTRQVGMKKNQRKRTIKKKGI